MKLTIVLFLTLMLSACASADQAKPKGEEAKPEVKKAPPIEVVDSGPIKKLAKIDPETLKITYTKGADPKRVVDILIGEWSRTAQELRQCRGQLEKKP